MVATTGGFQWLNPETQKVMNYMSGKRTVKQIVWEFFGLREEAVYDDAGTNLIDFINDFKDIEVLEKKWVHYHERFEALWVTREAFVALFPKWEPKYARTKSNSWTNWANASWNEEKKDTWVSSEIKDEQWLPSVKRRTRTTKK